MKTFVLVLFYWVQGTGAAMVTVENFATKEECYKSKIEFEEITRGRAWCIPGPTK